MTQNSYTNTTDYAGNFIYEDEALHLFFHPEGYVQPDGNGSFEYVYQYKDIWRNVRLSYSDSNNDGKIDSDTEILDEKNYYPFGLQHKGYNNTVTGSEHPYKFNGKELNKELGLDWYDFAARNYDASLGRWFNVDPLAELMYSHSPFSFAFNNPIYFTDPSGMVPSSGTAYTDYYIDELGRVIFNPSVNGPEDVPGDGEYIGPTYTDPETGTYWDENGNPHNSTQQLSAVTITAQGSSEERSKGFAIDGIGTNTAGRKGTITHSIEWDAFTSFGGGAKAINRLANLFQTIIKGLTIGWGLADKGEDILKPNESTMENKVEEEAENVPVIIKRSVFYSFPQHIMTITGPYTYEKARKDSARAMQYQGVDSVTISIINKRH